MRALASLLGLAFAPALLLAPVAARAQDGAPVPGFTASTAPDVPSPLLGLPVPLEVGGGKPARGGPCARYAGDAQHQLVSAGYEYVSDWFLLSAAAGYSVTPVQIEADAMTGLRPVQRTWLQLGLGLGIAPEVAVLGGDGGDVTLSLVPLLRVAGDAALAFDDAVSPLRLRGEGGLAVLAGFDFGLRLGAGATFDYDLTHFADEKVGEAGTVRISAQAGWLLEETSSYAEDKTPTLLLVGLGAELAAIESATRPTALSVTLGVSL